MFENYSEECINVHGVSLHATNTSGIDSSKQENNLVGHTYLLSFNLLSNNTNNDFITLFNILFKSLKINIFLNFTNNFFDERNLDHDLELSYFILGA